MIEARFGVIYSERGISRLLGELGFAHISARPQHPRQDKRIIEAFKKGSVYELYAWRVIAAAKQARGEVCGVSLMR